MADRAGLYAIQNAAAGKELLCAPTDISFTSGRALIFTKKTDDYMLTSVASPRLTPITPLRDTTTEYYATKLDNEWFHGTSLFVPGEYGYSSICGMRPSATAASRLSTIRARKRISARCAPVTGTATACSPRSGRREMPCTATMPSRTRTRRSSCTCTGPRLPWRKK